MITRGINLITLLLFLSLTVSAFAQKAIPPYDLWTEQVMTQIRDKSTLDSSVEPKVGYAEVYFTSNPSANFFDAKEPYAEHPNEKIRIHGYLVYPLVGGTFPAVVFNHGRGGHADLGLAQVVASLGVVALAIDGPQAGKSTGGPVDDIQAWISVDKGAQYGYLYHYAYAGMRALTLLESLAEQSGNPYKIDATKLGAIGVSSGAIATSIMNGVDNRMKAAVMVASAGNWQHTLRYPNSWLYHDFFMNTCNQPYNGKDPINSIANVDTDPTLISFLSHFDPIRYAPRQYGPVMTIIGTHDQYFPLPNANLTQLATLTLGAQTAFEKRLWLVQNVTNSMLSDANLFSLSSGIRQWLDYCFGKRAKPLATPQISLVEAAGGLRFEITINESSTRLTGSTVQFFAATRIDSTGVTPYNSILGFNPYPLIRDGTRYVASIVDGERSASGDAYTAQNVIYFATISDPLGLPVSSLAYKGKAMLDLSTDFTPVVEHHPSDQASIPIPPNPTDALRTVASSIPLSTYGYQGMALSNPTGDPMVIRIEARGTDGRPTAGEGLASPAFMTIQPHSEQIFVADQVLGLGASLWNGSFHVGWSDKRGTSLAFRGNGLPIQLDGIGPLAAPHKSLWLPLLTEHDTSSLRTLRLFSGSSSAAGVTVTYRTRLGEVVEKGQIIVPAWGRTDLEVNLGSGAAQVSSAQIESTTPISARLEVRPSRDTWSVDALPASSAGKFIQPHAEFNGTFKTRFIIMNTSATAGKRTIRFKRHKQSGEVMGNEMGLIMDNSQTAVIGLETIFSVSSSEAAGAGWIEIDADGGSLLIYALAYDPVRFATAVSPVGSGDSGTLSMPFFVENAGYWTGLAIANPGSAQASASIVAYGEKGEVLGQDSITLGPGQSKTQLVHQWISGLSEEATGQIVITTTSPLNLLAYFGSNEGASFAAIPFTPITP